MGGYSSAIIVIFFILPLLWFFYYPLRFLSILSFGSYWNWNSTNIPFTNDSNLNIQPVVFRLFCCTHHLARFLILSHTVFLNNPRLCRFESGLGSALLYNNFLYRWWLYIHSYLLGYKKCWTTTETVIQHFLRSFIYLHNSSASFSWSHA